MAVTVDTGPTTQLVVEKFGASQAFANELWKIAKEYLENIQGGTYAFSLGSLDTEISDIDTDIPDPQAPEDIDAELTLPDSPILDPLTSIAIPSISVPSFSGVEPDINIPDSPDVTWPEDPGEPPEFQVPTVPTKPDIDLPDAPDIQMIDIPDPPSIDIPVFDGVLPVCELDSPQTLFMYEEDVYQSILKDAINDNLLSLVNEGGTGLADDVEEAIWQRAQDRQALKNEQMYDEAETFFASRGFTLPPGALSGRIAGVQKEIARADQQLNYEIMIEQARLAQTNTHFALTTAVQHEANIMGYVSGVAERALNAAKIVQETAIAIFNAEVTKCNQKLAVYQTCAAVYESRIKAASLGLENYRIQLEGVKVQASIQEQYVRIYRSQIESCEALVGLYRTEVEAARALGEIEKLKLEGFRDSIAVYTAKLNAITSNYNAFQAEISGEMAKASVYAEQVRAYVGTVDAKKAESDIATATVAAQVEANKILLGKYTAEIEGYKTKVAAESKQLDIDGLVYGHKVEMYKADASRAAEQYKSNVARYTAESTHSSNVTNVKLAQSKIFLDEVGKRRALELEVAKSGATIAAQMAASALSAVAAGVQLSTRASLSGEVGEFYNHNLSV